MLHEVDHRARCHLSCDKSLRVVWDVGGQDKTRSLKCQYCQGTDGLICVVTATIVAGSQVQQKTVEMPQQQFVDEVVAISIVIRRLVPMLHTAQKTVQVPQVQCTDWVVDKEMIRVPPT